MHEALRTEVDIPTDKTRLFWQLQLGGWAAFATVQLLLGLSYLHLVEDLKNRLALFLSGLLLSLPLRAFYRRIRLRERRMLATVLVIVMTCIPLGALMVFVLHALSLVLRSDSHLPANLMDWINAIFTWWFILMGWSVLYIGINYRLDAEAERRRAIRAEALAQQARLQSLRAQLEPHFLFNTLNAISTLVLEKETTAALRMINTLGEFLRLTLDNVGSAEISVAQELEFARRYAEIQMARFNDRLNIVFDVDPAVLELRVPALILQPLVENAVKHGVLSQERPGTVTIKMGQQRARLHISVQDEGPGFRQESVTYGVGLGNTVARLEALYAGAAQFSVGTEDGGAVVHIDMPLRRMGET